MSQINALKVMKFTLISGLICLMASCSKAPSGVRAKVKSEQTNLTPLTNQATQQAAAANANYTIATISLPVEQEDGSFTVDVELKNPSGEYLPLTTRHKNSGNLSQGTYNDSQRGLLVSIEASCSYDQCSKYLFLVTVSKNGQKLFQSFAISYDSDCKFYTASASSTVGNFFVNLSAAESHFMSVQRTNDISTCSE
jgi:hypothetical protein